MLWKRNCCGEWLDIKLWKLFEKKNVSLVKTIETKSVSSVQLLSFRTHWLQLQSFISGEKFSFSKITFAPLFLYKTNCKEFLSTIYSFTFLEYAYKRTKGTESILRSQPQFTSLLFDIQNSLHSLLCLMSWSSTHMIENRVEK